MYLQCFSSKQNPNPQIWHSKSFSSSLYPPPHAKKTPNKPINPKQTEANAGYKSKVQTDVSRKKITFGQISRQWWFHQWKILNILSVRCTSRETIYCIGKSGIVIYALSRPQQSLPTLLLVFQGRSSHAGILEESICPCSVLMIAACPGWVTGGQTLIADFVISVFWFVTD